MPSSRPPPARNSPSGPGWPPYPSSRTSTAPSRPANSPTPTSGPPRPPSDQAAAAPAPGGPAPERQRCSCCAGAVWLGGEPFLERRPGQPGVRSRQQRTVGGSLAVWAGRFHLIDLDLAAAPGRDEPGQAGEVLLARARELRDRRPG